MYSKMFPKIFKSLGASSTIRKFLATNAAVQHKTKLDYTPLQIEVPWGKVEGKLWGSTDKQPLLAIHGWMDNAGSFDNVAPLLTNSSVLAVDLPGHGYSSWLPRGIPYDENIIAETMRLIVKKFGWSKVKLLGHSMGGILCYNYARLFPDETQFVISIDASSFEPSLPAKYTKKRAQSIDNLIHFEEKITEDPPSYPEEVAIRKWIKSAEKFSPLDVESTKILMIRGTGQKQDGTYYFTRDFRLSFNGFNSCYTFDDLKDISKLINCPYMVIRATQTSYFNYRQYWDNISNVLKVNSPDYRIVDIEGPHHIHLVKPDVVANLINPFLEKHDL